MTVVTTINGVEQAGVRAEVHKMSSGSVEFGTLASLPLPCPGVQHFMEYDAGRVEISPLEIGHQYVGETLVHRYRATFDPRSVV